MGIFHAKSFFKPKRIILLGGLFLIFLLLAGSGAYGIHLLLVDRQKAARRTKALSAAQVPGAAHSEETKMLLLECLRENLRDMPVLEALANLFEESDNFLEAQFLWERATRYFPENTNYRENLVRLQWILRDFPGLHQTYSRWIDSGNHCSNEILLDYAYLLSLEGKISDLEMVLAQFPEDFAWQQTTRGKMILLEQRTANATESDIDLLTAEYEALLNDSEDDLSVHQEILLALLDENQLRFPENRQRSETLLLQLCRQNPQIGEPMLANFYVEFGDFSAAINIFKRIFAKRNDSTLLIPYAESLAGVNNVAEMDRLAEVFKKGGREALQGAYFLEALSAFLRNDKEDLRRKLPFVRGRYNSPVATMMFLYGAVLEQDSKDVLQLLNRIYSEPDLAHLQEDAYHTAYPLVFQLKQLNRLAEAGILAQQLQIRRNPDLLLTRTVLEAKHIEKNLQKQELLDALKLFPKDREIWNIAVQWALYNEDYPLVLTLEEAVTPLGDAPLPDQVRALRLRALEGMNRISEANQEYLDLLKSPEQQQSRTLPAHYLAFCYNHELIDALQAAATRFRAADAPPAWKILGDVAEAEAFLASGEPEKAIPLLKQLVAASELDSNDSTDTQILFFCSQMLALQDCPKEAIAGYQRIKQSYDPAFLVALNLSELYAAIEDYPTALEYSQKAISAQPDQVTAQLCHAIRLTENHRYSEAAAILGDLFDHTQGKVERIRSAWRDAERMDLLEQPLPETDKTLTMRLAACKKYRTFFPDDPEIQQLEARLSALELK